MFKYYSQFGVDKYLFEKYFWMQETGVFIDIGAHDGITGSNTLFFEKEGWTGICFEPMPKAFLKLSQTRTCQLSNKAISDFEGKANFVAIDGYSEQLSGLQDNYSEEHFARINREMDAFNQTIETIQVDCGLFNKEVPRYPTIDLLSIDTEGSESKILKSIDYNKYNILYIVAEFNQADEDLVNFLDSKGFKIETKLGVDVIFKREQ